MPRWSRKLYCQSNGQVHFRISIFITMNIFLMSTATSISKVHIPIINYILVEPGLCGIIVQPEAGLSAPPGPSAEISPVIIIWADIKHNTHWHQSLPGYISNELMSTGIWYYQVIERDGNCWKVCLSFRSTVSTLLKKNTVLNYKISIHPWHRDTPGSHLLLSVTCDIVRVFSVTDTSH